MSKTAQALLSHVDTAQHPLASALIPVVTGPVHWSSAGFPYLDKNEFEAFRDTLPWLLSGGAALRDAADHILEVSAPLNLSGQPALELGLRVVRTVLNSAAITAPPDLLMIRQVLSTLHEVGITTTLLDGKAITPERDSHGLDPRELTIDLSFLMSRGYLTDTGDGLALSNHPTAKQVFTATSPTPHGPLAESWSALFEGHAAPSPLLDALASLSPPAPDVGERSHWMANWSEIETAYRLVPLVLGLQRSGWAQDWAKNDALSEERAAILDSEAGKVAHQILASAGVTRSATSTQLTETGRRTLDRGAGPFGIIEAYHPYMHALGEILQHMATVRAPRTRSRSPLSDRSTRIPVTPAELSMQTPRQRHHRQRFGDHIDPPGRLLVHGVWGQQSGRQSADAEHCH